jgi:ABC-2 type transport system permease protein
MRFLLMLKKEFIVISRDAHALLALFVMPLIFILIMSLATKELMSTSKPVIELMVVDRLENNISQTMIEEMDKSLKILKEDRDISNETLDKKLLASQNSAVLIIDKNISLRLNPSMKKEFEAIVLISVGSASKTAVYENVIKSIPHAPKIDKNSSELKKEYIYKDGKQSKTPTSVQQSVPAWLVFSMFFIVIAVSNSFIAERTQGTLQRIRTMNVSRTALIASKFVPYFAINQAQVAAMIAVGMYVVPLFGGDRFECSANPIALVVLSSAVSFAAISFAFLVAVVAKSTEESTTIGGVSNIIFGALGGVMVPKFVMPESLQNASLFSPMSWALDGFLDMFVNGAGVIDILPRALALLLFAGVCFMAAATVLKYKKMESA